MNYRTPAVLAGLLLFLIAAGVSAHGVSGADARFLNDAEGFHFVVYLYLGAKHMVTGYDHILFLFGVIFYLSNLRTVALYVSLFALGHSITLIAGVLMDLHVNVYIIDAIIGVSVIYKAFDNLGGFERLFGVKANNRSAVFIFGLFHGLGLATKLQELQLSEQGLFANLLSFNLGVEIGQLLALMYLLLLLKLIQRFTSTTMVGISINFLIMTGGFALTAYQLSLYFSS
ncbi:MAG: HupE/UreJ family protein [Gammaproteobacteria bacterium]|nr:HupE/UreJ family protein [Gammaproteobacteria bacterium]